MAAVKKYPAELYAEQGENESSDFSVLQWADCFKTEEEEKTKQESLGDRCYILFSGLILLFC